ncbi:MAG: hypothetical protein AAFN78_13075 [Pseudomonadota bacterium]
MDTASTVDTVHEVRRWLWSGDVRPILAFAELDARDGRNVSDTIGGARLRLKGTVGLADGLTAGARLAGRCVTDSCDADWYFDPELPQTTGLANGQVTADELYVHFSRPGKFDLTIGRQQIRSILRAGVFFRSLNQVDSNNTRITWTDGLHFTTRRGKGWEIDATAQYNSPDGSGGIRRGPLDFSPGKARVSYGIFSENLDAFGPIVQRALAVSYLPGALLKDGDVNGRREDYLGVVGRVAARWPQRAEGFRFRAGLEVGYAPQVPTATGAGIDGDVGKFAWNVTASLMDVLPGHSVGINYANTRAGWLLSPNFPDNEESFEVRWLWRSSYFPPVDARIRWRQDIERAVDSNQRRESVEAFLRLTWQFGGA